MKRSLKTDWEEEHIQELFDEMRRRDEQTAPSFYKTLQIPVRAGTSARPIRVLKIAAALVILILISSFAADYFRQPRSHQFVVTVIRPEKAKTDNHPLLLFPNTDPPKKQLPVRRSFRKRIAGQKNWLVTRWQYPTDFLLKTPGDELLKTIPRLNDSRLKIDAIIPDEEN